MTALPRLQVLLVEDDPGDARLLRTALRGSNGSEFELHRATTLAEAISAVRERLVDVVLLDLSLPDAVGISTLEAFTAAAPDVPVVVVTHVGDDELALEAVRAGAQDYVTKGTVDAFQLGHTVRHAAERGRLARHVRHLAERQRVLVELGRLAVDEHPVVTLFHVAAELIGACLEARLALVVQRRADGRLVIRSCVGDESLVGQALPSLLASQLPRSGDAEPQFIDDVAYLTVPAREDVPPGLADAATLVVLPLRQTAWSGALVLVDTPTVHRDEDTLIFLQAAGALLQESLRRSEAEFDVQERVKELGALAAVGRALQETAPREQLLAAAAHALVEGMQYPLHAVACIEVDEVVVVSDGRDRGGLVEELIARIVVDGDRRGAVRVGHRAQHGFIEVYEQQLVDAVAETIALWLEREDTLARVREREAELRSVLEQMPGLVWTVDTDMVVQWHQGRAHDDLDVEPNHDAGARLEDVFESDHPIHDAAARALEGRAAFYESSHDGRSFQTQVEPLRNDDGTIIGALGMGVDVTDAVRAQTALRSSEERFRRLAENARDIIYRFAVAGEPRFEYVSPAVEDLLGLPPDDLYADPSIPLDMLTSDEDRDRLVESVTGHGPADVPFVARIRPRGGGELWIEERHSPVHDEDGVHVATEGVVRDITARKQLEDDLRAGLAREQAASENLRELNEMKDVFLTAVSHELRTPLTSLKGIAHTLHTLDADLTPDQRSELLERLSANADRLEVLLDDLLDLDRLTRGASLLDLHAVDVADLVNHTLQRLPTLGQQIVTELQPVQIDADEPKLERVVENLVVNALRHAGPDTPIWVEVEPADGGASIRVEDAGPGVPEHLRERIFEPFQHGDSPAARVGGLGIGLNLVLRFVQLHGGTVDVGERNGGGAAFHVWLPDEPPAEPGLTVGNNTS